MTEDQIHCANVARLLSETFPGSDPNVLPPLPPRGTEEPPSSFVEAQQQRGVVRRSFERVGPDEAVKLAEQHAPEGLEELYKAAGGEAEYRKALEEPRTVHGVAPPRLTLEGYVGAGGGRDLKVNSACEVRGEDGSWRGGVVEAVIHADDEFDWDTSTFTVELLDGDQAQGVRGGDIRAPQKLVERTVRTGLEGFGERDFDARSPVGRAVALTTVSPEARADATLSADAGRRRARAEKLSTFGEDEDRDASMDDVDRGADPASLNLSSTRRGRGHAVDAAARASRAARLERDGFVHTDPLCGATAAPADVLDDAAAPAEHAPTSEADGDAMKIDAPPAEPRALLDATAPPLLGPGPATGSAPPTTTGSGEGGPDAAMADAHASARALPVAAPSPAPVAAPETTTAASEPAPPTTTESVEDDGDAVMAPVKGWRDIARKFHEVAGAASKKADKACFALVPLHGEDAKDYVPRVLEKYSKKKTIYDVLATALLGNQQRRALNGQGKKDAVFGALEGVSAADFRDKSKFTEAVAPTPAPASSRTTEPLPWEPDVEKLLQEIKDLSPKQIVPKVRELSFTKVSFEKGNFRASAPDDWPCVHDIIGDKTTEQYRNVITSKTQLVAYLEGALAYACEGKSFRLESVRKEEDAEAARAGPTVSEKRLASLAKGNAIKSELGEEDVAHWHVVANEAWRHRLYQDMKANGVVFKGKDEHEPFLLLGPSNHQPPKRPVGFYAGTLPPGVDYRCHMSEEKCTTAEQKAAWREARRVCQILNGVGDEDGVYKLEYEAWKAMGGDDSVVGSRKERQNYSQRGLYAEAIKRAINAMRRDEPRRFSHLALGALKAELVRSPRHLKALAKHAGVDEEDLVRKDSYGRERFVSGSGPCRLPPPLEGLMRTLNIEHVNGDWDDDGSAKLKLKVRGFEDARFNRAEPHYAFITERPELRAFVDGYLHHGALCFSEDEATRGLFQFYMDPISTAARREFLALPSDERSKEERDFLRKVVMAGVVKPKTDEDRRRRATLLALHGAGLTFVPNSSGGKGHGTWMAVSRVQGRKKEIGKWYGAEILRQYGSGSNATFDVKFDDGYVAKGVTAGDVRRGRREHEQIAPDVGATGEACYRGTRLDLDHVGLGWRWEPVEPSEEYPDGLKWYRILGIRDLLDYDINQHLSGYEWAKNLDLFDYFDNYYKNALCEVGGYGIKASDWVFGWTPALGWAYGAFS
jgi:hypothetical protein